MPKHIVQTKDITYRDENGIDRAISTEKTLVHKTESDPFYGTYINYVGWIYDIRGGIALQLIVHMMNIAEFNTGQVVFSTAERKRFMKRTGCSRAALYKALAKLISVGAIAPVVETDTDTGEIEKAQGEFVVNPEMFWKGELSKRHKLIVSFKTENEDLKYDNNPAGYEFSGSSMTSDF